MDKEQQQFIAKKIEDKSYFKDAYDWYGSKYLRPVSQRSYLIILNIILGLLVWFVYDRLIPQYGGTTTPKIINYVDYDSPYSFSYIKPLIKKNETPQVATLNYLLANYVKAREEYMVGVNTNTREYRKITNLIRRSSTKNVLNEYNAKVRRSNRNSPFIVFKDNINRKITIDDIIFLEEDLTVGRAKIIFTEEITKIRRRRRSSSDQSEPVKNKFEATIHFNLSDLETIAANGSPIRFLVSYYRDKKI